MKVRYTQAATAEVRRLRNWWKKNRPAAPMMLSNELREARKDLARNPRIGTMWKERDGKRVYRLLLERTKNWVYYEVDDASKTVLIVAVWGAPRGRQPADDE